MQIGGQPRPVETAAGLRPSTIPCSMTVFRSEAALEPILVAVST